MRRTTDFTLRVEILNTKIVREGEEQEGEEQVEGEGEEERQISM